MTDRQIIIDGVPVQDCFVILSQEFITDFLNYLAKPRRKRKLSNEQIFLIKKELEELLKCEQATA